MWLPNSRMNLTTQSQKKVRSHYSQRVGEQEQSAGPRKCRRGEILMEEKRFAKGKAGAVGGGKDEAFPGWKMR